MPLFSIGYFSRTHGTKGQLILKCESDFNQEETKVFYLELGGSQAPFFIEEIKENNADLIIKLEGIDSIEKAKTILNKSVFIDAITVVAEEENEWADYELIDKKFGSLGKVVSVSDNGQQVLWHLNFKGREVILPLVEEFIEKVEESKKKIHYNAPDGLIELYLESDE